MPPRIDISGQKFGKLTVVRCTGKRGRPYVWECICECGNTVSAAGGDLRRGSPCQCWECAKASRIKHGCSPSKNKHGTKEYKAWASAKQRCTNPNLKSYADYGGRGIKFHSSWNDFRSFFADMGPCPEGYSLDRIDVNGGYEPGNCRWATAEQQQNNRRVNRRVTYKGETKTTAEWAAQYGISLNYLLNNLNKGYTLSEVIERRVQNGEKYKRIKFRRENSPSAKLTHEAVAVIVEECNAVGGTREIVEVRKRLADRYGVSARYIWEIMAGRTNWAGGYRDRTIKSAHTMSSE